MRHLIVMILCTMSCIFCTAQTDPVLAGMIVAYTDKAESELKSQEKVMALQTTGHLWMREEIEATTDFQRTFNDYLDSFNTVISYAAQIYGFYHEIGKLSENMGKLSGVLKDNPTNALAVALYPKRSGIYRNLVLSSVEIVNDIRLVCLSDSKMTEKDRIAIIFGIRPKLKNFNILLRNLTLAVKYTTMADVWREIDITAKSYEVDKGKVTDDAFRRWLGNGRKIRP